MESTQENDIKSPMDFKSDVSESTKKPKPNEHTEKVKKLMRQLSEQSPRNMSATANSMLRIFLVVALYW